MLFCGLGFLKFWGIVNVCQQKSLSYNPALSLKTLLWYKYKKNTLFCSDFGGSLLSLKYFKAEKPNSKFYVNSIYFTVIQKGVQKLTFFNMVTFYNHFTGQQRKKLQKPTQLCSSVPPMSKQLLLLTNET